MVYIYILQLEQGKFYVGKTDNPQFRMERHFDSNGSAWTRKYRPVRLVELIPNCDDYDEDKYTRMYMDMYGIDNVRGGSFVSLELDTQTVRQLTQMKRGTNNMCFRCGEKGHFANECGKNEETDSDYEEVWECEYCNKEFTNEQICRKHEPVCNRKPYIRRHSVIRSPSSYAKIYSNDTSDIDDDLCYRCGREGHYAKSCYASTHINGSKLR